MSSNPILDELHATRTKLLTDAGGDLHRYVIEARERALTSGHPIAEVTPRTNPCIPIVKLGTVTSEDLSSQPDDQ